MPAARRREMIAEMRRGERCDRCGQRYDEEGWFGRDGCIWCAEKRATAMTRAVAE